MEETIRHRIIERTTAMVLSQGVKSVRMDDIAHDLGISKRTLYEQFADKQELLSLVVDRYLEQNRKRHEEIASKASNIIEALFATLEMMREESPVIHRLLSNLRKFYPAIYERVMRTGGEHNRRSMRALIRVGIEQGLFMDDMNSDLSITVYYHSLTALVNGEIRIPEEMDRRGAIRQLIVGFCRMRATPEGMKAIDACCKRYR